MTKKEAAKLLTLVKLSYPASYKDMDDEWLRATINMWASSFPDVPYSIMEQGFNRYRMTHKFPPTVAEMVEELRHIHGRAMDLESISRITGNKEALRIAAAVVDITERYTNERELGAFGIEKGGALIGNSGTPGNRLDRADGLPFLDAGRDV